MFAAADKVIAWEHPTSWKLTAFKYDHIGEAKMGDAIVGVGNILIEPTPDLLRLQQELAVAIKPFEAPTGTAAAFVTAPQAPNNNLNTAVSDDSERTELIVRPTPSRHFRILVGEWSAAGPLHIPI